MPRMHGLALGMLNSSCCSTAVPTDESPTCHCATCPTQLAALLGGLHCSAWRLLMPIQQLTACLGGACCTAAATCNVVTLLPYPARCSRAVHCCQLCLVSCTARNSDHRAASPVLCATVDLASGTCWLLLNNWVLTCLYSNMLAVSSQALLGTAIVLTHC